MSLPAFAMKNWTISIFFSELYFSNPPILLNRSTAVEFFHSAFRVVIGNRRWTEQQVRFLRDNFLPFFSRKNFTYPNFFGEREPTIFFSKKFLHIRI